MEEKLTLMIDEELARAAGRLVDLDHLFITTGGNVGKVSWSRDDLHERYLSDKKRTSWIEGAIHGVVKIH